jgi:acetyl esterase/lipase
MLALTPNDPDLQPGFEDADTSVQGCVPIYGVYDFTAIQADWRHEDMAPFLERHVMKVRYEDDPAAFEKASPVHRVRPDAPPFFVVHGAADTLVPVGEARAFVDALRRAGASPVVYAEIPGAQHAFELFPSLRSNLTREGIERFLAVLWSEHLRSGPGQQV